MLQHLIDAIMIRVKALETEAAHLVQEGEVEAANLKTTFAKELKALATEIENVLSHL